MNPPDFQSAMHFIFSRINFAIPKGLIFKACLRAHSNPPGRFAAAPAPALRRLLLLFAGLVYRANRSKFDLPEADKCLLAFGELDVRCLTFNLLTGIFYVKFPTSPLPYQKVGCFRAQYTVPPE